MDGPITIAKAKPIKCRRDEELVEREDGTKLCLMKFGAGESTAIRIQGRFLGPERISTINLEEPTPPIKIEKSTPPAPKDQFEPAPPKPLEEVIKGKAEYSCKTKMRTTEYWTVTRDVSVARIPNEPEQATRARLEKAARDLAKTITGCYDVKFQRIQPTKEEQAKAAREYQPPRNPFADLATYISLK